MSFEIVNRNITSAQYCSDGTSNVCIKIQVDGNEEFVPISESNKEYVEVMKKVDDGDLTIKAADSSTTMSMDTE